MDSNQVRQKPNEFAKSIRGYDRGELSSYLARVALLVEALNPGGQDQGDVNDLPTDLLPQNIRAQEFPIVWLGSNRDQVRTFLDEMADGVQGFLAS